MVPLTEDRTKAWLREAGIPVPAGLACEGPEAAREAAQALGGAIVVKALVPAGRRGKAGAVRMAEDPEAAAEVARAMIGAQVAGHVVERVYVEARVEIAEALYLAFSFDGPWPRVLASCHGGVEIEATHSTQPEAVTVEEVDVLAGIRPWEAIALWRRAGLKGPALARLGRLTARLYECFRTWDAVLLEVNPLALDREGRPVLVGAMVGIDDDALARQEAQLGDQAAWMFADPAELSPRERAVREAQLTLQGGMIRYTELDGDIGLIVNGGGAGLYQHDLITAIGGRPANHSDQNGINVEKLKVLVRAVLDHPNVKGLLVSANHQQMTRTDRKVQPIIEVLKERGVDTTAFPVVIRMLGPYDEAARTLAAEVPGVRYLPPNASLEDACRLIVELTRQVQVRGVGD